MRHRSLPTNSAVNKTINHIFFYSTYSIERFTHTYIQNVWLWNLQNIKKIATWCYMLYWTVAVTTVNVLQWLYLKSWVVGDWLSIASMIYWFIVTHFQPIEMLTELMKRSMLYKGDCINVWECMYLAAVDHKASESIYYSWIKHTNRWTFQQLVTSQLKWKVLERNRRPMNSDYKRLQSFIFMDIIWCQYPYGLCIMFIR